MKEIRFSTTEFVVSLLLPALFVFIFRPFLDRWPFLLGISTTMIWMPKYLENDNLSRMQKLLFAAGLCVFNLLLIHFFCPPESIRLYHRLYFLVHVICASVLCFKSLLKKPLKQSRKEK